MSFARSFLLVLSALVSPGAESQAASSPSIVITSVPAFGSGSFLTGRATGVDPATHEVAVFIQIEGSGWWSKPTNANPTVPIAADGTFSANVVTGGLGGLDPLATIFCVDLLPIGTTVPHTAAAPSVPSIGASLATDCFERPGHTLEFAGRTWAIKQTHLPVGPGQNVFSSDPSDVWVDATGKLHLTIRFHDGAWWSTEVWLLESLGLGTYSFVTESEVEDLDPNATFGAFPWDPYGDDFVTPGNLHREIDFEDSRWTDGSDPTTSQVVVQPYTSPGNLTRYTLPDLSGDPTLTRFFDWQAGRVDFVAARGFQATSAVDPASIIHASTFVHAPGVGNYVPPPGRERFRFNLWLNPVDHGGAPPPAPAGSGPIEVVISNFTFSPTVDAFPYGCYTNPVGSLRVLAGEPTLGTTLVLGIDNPLGTQAIGSVAVLRLRGTPGSLFPCGVLIPGWGMAGGDGELLIPIAPLKPIFFSPVPWSGAGSPSPIQLSIPFDPSLAGALLYAQGALLDPTPGASIPVGLTGALLIRLDT